MVTVTNFVVFSKKFSALMHFEHNFGLTSNIRDKKNVHGSHFSDTLVLDFLSRPPQTVRNIVLESESSTPH